MRRRFRPLRQKINIFDAAFEYDCQTFEKPAVQESISVRDGQAEHIPDFFTDGSAARQRYESAFGHEQRDIDGPEN